MRLESFFENFELLAEAQGGVQKLRELVLQLAVQGKLVAQDPRDEPAEVLVQKIETEKRRLVKEKKIRLPANQPPLPEDEVPNPAPQGWVWTRLVEVGLINPRNDADDETEVSFVPMALVPQDYDKQVGSESRKWGEIKKGFTHFAEGDVAIAKITPCYQNRKSAVMRGLNNGLGAGTTELHVFRPYGNFVLPEYVLLYFKSPRFMDEGISKMTGTAGQQRVPKEHIALTPFPLPPLEEQKRIVAKVDELMTLCDKLEQRQQKRNEARALLNKASLNALTTSESGLDFNTHWRRITKNFHHLYTSREAVNELRQAILQLAVQGKLVPQDPNDEPAEALLENVQQEKERLIAENRYQHSKMLPRPDKSKLPSIPKNWLWANIGDICLSIVPNRDKPKTFSGSIPWLTLPNFDDKTLELHFQTNQLGLTEKEVKEFNARIIPAGSVVMSCVGRFGLVAVLAERVVANQQVHGFVVPTGLNPRYLAYVVKSQREFLEMSSTSTTIAYLNKTRCESIPTPLPPSQEQNRIVAKVDQLMTLCDELEAKLERADSDSQKLVEAVVHWLEAA